MIYEKFMHTWNSQDIAGYFSCLHDDYQMIFHSTGKILRLEDFDMDQLARWMIQLHVKVQDVFTKMKIF